MRKSWQPLAVAVTVALSVAGSVAVQAQELRDRDRTLAISRQLAEDLRRARIHYGPFYLLSSIQLADIGYDEDFFVPVADTNTRFRFGISAPQRLYFTPNRKSFFSVSVTPQWSRFGGTNGRNQTGYKGRADAQFLLNHLYIDVYGAKEDALHADIGEISSLLTRKSQDAGVAGELKYSSRTSLTYAARAHKEEYPFGADRFQPADFPVEILDRTEHSYRLGLAHKTFPLTSLFVAGEYAGYSFPNAAFRNAHRRYAGGGFIYESGRTTSRLEGGYARLDFIRDTQKDFKGPVANFTISHQVSDRFGLNAGASRDLAFSVFLNNNYYVANRAQFGARYSLTRRVSLTSGWTLVEDDYDIPTAGSKAGTVAKRRDRMSFPYIGWSYTSPNHFTGGFDVGYLERSSNFPIAETDGIRIVLHLSLNL